MAITIGSPLAVVLDEELMRCRICRGALAEGTEEDDDTVDAWLTTFLCEAHKNMREAGMLFIRNQEKETVVKPGETRTVNFLLRQPNTLNPTTRYFAVAFFYTANLHITLVPCGATRPRLEERPPSGPKKKRGSRNKPEVTGSST